MLARALLAFLALPGVVAIAVPAWMGAGALRDGGRVYPVGLLPLFTGFALLAWCVRDFYVAGSRNPMYVAVTMMLAGWAVAFASWTIAIYAGFVIGAFQIRVVYGEEPWLARRHGVAWDEYRARVPRWLV